MELNLIGIGWPVCVIQCHETLTRLQPGEDLIIIVSDSDVVDNIVLLIKSQPDLTFEHCQESHGCRISVRRLKRDPHAGTDDIQEAKK